MIESLSAAIEFRDGESGDHVRRIHDITKMVLECTRLGDGLTAEDMDSFAVSLSLMNTQAYCVAVIKPAEGAEDTVKNGLQNYIDTQMQSFEHYLVDQYEIASNARFETLDDGTVVLVMCEDADTVYDAVIAGIEAE